MIYKFEYANETDKALILEQHKEKYLIEEQNIREGNFLIFSDTEPLLPETIPTLEEMLYKRIVELEIEIEALASGVTAE